MSQSSIDRRRSLVEAAMADIREIEAADGVNRDSIADIRDRLIELAGHTDVFTSEAFPPPEDGGFMYRVAQDPDDRFALYVRSSRGEGSAPPHDHTTWASVVGVSGSELNRFYEHSGDGVAETGEFNVVPGTGIAMMPDDLHSIHLSEPSINLHCYGLALERLTERVYLSKDGWLVFNSTAEIVEAR